MATDAPALQFESPMTLEEIAAKFHPEAEKALGSLEKMGIGDAKSRVWHLYNFCTHTHLQPGHSEVEIKQRLAQYQIYYRKCESDFQLLNRMLEDTYGEEEMDKHFGPRTEKQPTQTIPPREGKTPTGSESPEKAPKPGAKEPEREEAAGSLQPTAPIALVIGKASPGIALKLIQAAAEIDNIEKRGYNEAQKYAYVLGEDIFREVKKALAKVGVAFLPNIVKIHDVDFVSKSGTKGKTTTVWLQYTFVDASTGESITATWQGTADDYGGNGVSKACTGGLKTFLKSMFLISTEEDDDAPAKPTARK